MNTPKTIELRGRSPSPQRRISKSTGKTYCKFGCGKKCTAKGVYEHERHHCPRNPNRVPKQIERKQCFICGEWFNGHYLRVHMACQHAGVPVKLGRPPQQNPRTSPAPKKTAKPRETDNFTNKPSRGRRVEPPAASTKQISPGNRRPNGRTHASQFQRKSVEDKRKRVFELMAPIRKQTFTT